VPTVLVTGANRGLGLEFVRQYAAEGWRVIAACRDPDGAVALNKIKGDVAVHKLDVTNAKQIAALARALKGEPIDLLINNAGINPNEGDRPGRMDYDAWEETLSVNTIAPFRVTEALLPNLLMSKRKTVVSMTSGLGSIARNTDGGIYAYRSSKAALNMAMRSLAADLRGEGVTVVVFSPGWVRTDMGGRSAPVGVKESITGMRSVIARLKRSDSGRFFNYEGNQVPW
jgi:NAD(P)-dependent dehydrogenase (short-subunit alcohol dehydrogenase family)